MLPFTIALVPGVTPDRWVRTWNERHPERPLQVVVVDEAEQTEVLWQARADMAFVRLPADRDGLHVIPLYEEQPVVVLPREHPFAEEPSLRLADLADEHLLQDPADVPGWDQIGDEVREGTGLDLPPMSLKHRIEVVASGTGFVVVPLSLARLHHRKDVVAVPLEDGPVSAVGLAWRTDHHDPGIEDFIGVVRGRTANSSRGSAPDPTPTPKRQPRPERGGRRSTAKAPRSRHGRRR